MARLKMNIVVLLLVVVAAGGALVELTKVFQKRALADAESRATSSASIAVNFLRLEAFERIQKLSRESRNPSLLTALAKLPPGASPAADSTPTALTGVHDELFPTLKNLLGKLKVGKLLVLSPEGQLLAEAPDQTRVGESLKGLPAVQDCIAGVSRDGFYEINGKLTQLALTPILDDKGKIAGCILSEDEFGIDNLSVLSKNLRIEVALFLRKAVAASTLDEKLLQPLTQQVDSGQAVWFGEPEAGTPMLTSLDGRAFVAAATTIPTATDPMRLAVIQPVVGLLGPLGVAQKNLLFGAGALLIVALLVTIFLPTAKDRQIRRLRDEVVLMSSGDRSYALDANKYSGPYRDLATAISQLGGAPSALPRSETVAQLLGRVSEPPPPDRGSAVTPSQEGAPLDFESLLGGPTTSARPAAVSSPPPAGAPARSSASQPPPAAAMPMQSSPSQPPPARPSAAPPFAAGARPVPATGPRVELPGELAGIFDEQEETREVQAIVPPQARPDPLRQHGAAVSSPAPSSPRSGFSPPPASVNFESPLMSLANDVQQVTSSDYHPDATVVAQMPDQLLRAAASGADLSELGLDAAEIFTGLPNPPVAPTPSSGHSGAHSGLSPEETHFRDVFEQFLKTKRQCNEPTAGLTYDKFSEKLHKNAADLKTRYKCATVKFQVYVKNGKAALKATPAK